MRSGKYFLLFIVILCSFGVCFGGYFHNFVGGGDLPKSVRYQKLCDANSFSYLRQAILDRCTLQPLTFRQTYESSCFGNDWKEISEKVFLFPDKYCLEAIDGGASNHNYRFQYEGKYYFLRKALQTDKSLYSDSVLEFEVLQKLKNLKVSPEPHYFDPEGQILITDYIEHVPFLINLSDKNVRKEIFKLLHRIEDSEIKIERIFRPSEVVTDLLRQVSYPLSLDFYRILLPILEKVSGELESDLPKSLCHLDLHCLNILKGNDQFWIVDWEYATMSHPLLVLASMASIERWDDDQMFSVLEEYKGDKGAVQDDRDRLFCYRLIIDIFWTVWNHLQSECSGLDVPYAEWSALYERSALDRAARVVASKF